MNRDKEIRKIIKRDGAIAAYNRQRIANAIGKAMASVGEPNLRLAGTIAAKVEAALIRTGGTAQYPSVEDIQDVVESVLMENGLTRTAKSYILYRQQRSMARAAKSYSFEVTDNVPYKKIYEVLRWNIEHGCESVQALNSVIAGGDYPALVRACESRYNDEVKLAAEDIISRNRNIRIAIIAGPSSSGKTTTTLKLGEHLRRAGMRLKTINIDHYFFDLDKHPRDEFGDYDYERPESLDLGLINRHLVKLLDGESVKTPHYDFKSGTRELNIHPLSLKKNEILLIDSLHGLYDGMTSSIPQKNKYKLYIETLGQFRAMDGTFMRWADNRLLRRMIRDASHRNLKPIQTLTHWHYVRRSEIKNIIPFLKHTDFIINSALPYELPILKNYLFKYVSEARHRFADDPKRLDAHIRANRVYDLLKPLLNVKSERCIPSDSLLREFIGGSRYTY